DALEIARQLDHFPGVVSAGSGEHRHTAVRFLDHELHDPQLVAMRERRRLAGRSARRQEVHAPFDLALRQALDRRLVERAVLGERRDQRGTDACEWGAHGWSPVYVRRVSRLASTTSSTHPAL